MMAVVVKLAQVLVGVFSGVVVVMDPAINHIKNQPHGLNC